MADTTDTSDSGPEHTWAEGEGRDSDPPADELADGGRRETVVQIRIFAAIGVAVTAMAAIYALTAYEDAGTTMLVLAAGLSFTCGAYLYVQIRATQAGPADAPSDDLYLPHQSIWPFWVGVGVFLISNGLLLGTWFLVPGVLVLLFGVAGFVRQSRARS